MELSVPLLGNTQSSVILDAQTRTLTMGNETLQLPPREFILLAVLMIARKHEWPGAGPEEEGTGPNASGFIFFDDIRCGRDAEDKPRQTRARTLIEAMLASSTDERTRSENDCGAFLDWFGATGRQSLGVYGTGYGDAIAQARSKLKQAVSTKIANPYIQAQVNLTERGRKQDLVLGVNIKPSRIELRGFEAYVEATSTVPLR